MINVQDICCRFEGRTIFDNISFFVNKGHKIGLIGENGAGKSTIFRMLMDELDPDHGTIDKVSSTVIGTVHQEMIYADDMTIIDYVLSSDTLVYPLLKELENLSDPDRLEHIMEVLEAHDGFGAHSRAAKILKGLGLEDERHETPLKTLSGGWKMRVNLAAALFRQPDLLLLDEPTNHLDLESTYWLKSYLKNYAGSILVISHDPDFLNHVPQEIFYLTPQKMMTFKGNYDTFKKTLGEQIANQDAYMSKRAAFEKRTMDFVNRFRAKPTKAKQVQSRVKMMQRYTPMPPIHEAKGQTFAFEAVGEAPHPMVKFDLASLGYEDNLILKRLSMSLYPDDQIALVGPNGSGKSTFVKSIVGDVPPVKGTVTLSRGTTLGYFHQHTINAFDLTLSPLETIQQRHPRMIERECRTALGRFGVQGDLALNPLKKLSGGEKAKLAFCLIALQKPNFLILDEPTNHLDLQARDALIEALSAFEGAVLIISHDLEFLRLTTDQVWVTGDQKVHKYDGTIEQYLKGYAGQKD
ncbi:ATP-binding cassette domain-containing protein [Alphaproteobacteria bacterium]|nr:ATP-binding cassette domain-containing protein [Alphaproteobacteria bacterium]